MQVVSHYASPAYDRIPTWFRVFNMKNTNYLFISLPTSVRFLYSSPSPKRQKRVKVLVQFVSKCSSHVQMPCWGQRRTSVDHYMSDAHSRNALLFHRVKCFCDVMDKSQVFDLLWGLKILTTTLRIEEIAYPRAVLTFTSNNEDLF